MSNLFTLQKSSIFPDDHFYVYWDPSIDKFIKTLSLMDEVFGHLDCKEAGFGVRLNSGEINALWIDRVTWSQDKSKEYGHYLQNMYDIRGVLFKQNDKAKEFHELLEKKYMWDKLNE